MMHLKIKKPSESNKLLLLLARKTTYKIVNTTGKPENVNTM